MKGSQNEVLLLFDIGNTRIKWAFAHNKTILVKDAFVFSPAGLSDCIRHVELLLERFGLDGLTKVMISSVAGVEVLDGVRDSIKARWGLKAETVKVEPSFRNIVNRYRRRDQLGVDRWVAVIGASQYDYEGAKIIVDVGTAVTVDYLSSSDEYLGGAILPGRDLIFSLLNLNTANIVSHQDKVTEFESFFGATTSECINIGSHAGLNGAVAAIIEGMLEEMPEPTHVLLCGGGAESVDAYLKTIKYQHLLVVESKPDLILSGLIALS